MTKEEIKHRDELSKASHIIRELGYEPNISMYDDRPDIVLPSKTDRRIGIGVVTYSTHRKSNQVEKGVTKHFLVYSCSKT